MGLDLTKMEWKIKHLLLSRWYHIGVTACISVKWCEVQIEVLNFYSHLAKENKGHQLRLDRFLPTLPFCQSQADLPSQSSESDILLKLVAITA